MPEEINIEKKTTSEKYTTEERRKKMEKRFKTSLRLSQRKGFESCKMSRRVVEDYLMLLLDKLRKAQPGDDLTRCLPCYLTA